MTVAVVGGRGKTGRAVIAAIEASGDSARALGRAELREPVAAFDGCQAAYLIAPNMHPDEPAFIADLLAAVHAAGIQRVVYHSVAAPYLPEMPHHLGKAEAERQVRASGLDWTILQPCAYVQNFVPQLTAAQPELTAPYNPDRHFGFIDVVDVAEIAARVLPDSSLIGATLELGGPALASVNDIAQAASQVLRREVPVHHITTDQWAADAGPALGERERQWLIAMFEYYDQHGLACGSTATRALLEREPHSVQQTLSREL